MALEDIMGNILQIPKRARTGKAGWSLVLALPDESPSFAHGFEAGDIWRRMRLNRPISQMVHNENREILRRMAETRAWAIGFIALNNEWSEMTLTPPVR